MHFFHCFPYVAPSEEVLTYECFGNNSEGAARDAVKIHVVEDYKYGRHSRRILIFSKIYLHLSYRLLSRPPTEEVATVANVGFFEYDGGGSQKTKLKKYQILFLLFYSFRAPDLGQLHARRRRPTRRRFFGGGGGRRKRRRSRPQGEEEAEEEEEEARRGQGEEPIFFVLAASDGLSSLALGAGRLAGGIGTRVDLVAKFSTSTLCLDLEF